MRKLLVLLFLLLIGFIVFNRQRIYLRDPLASVTLAGHAVSGVKVMINYSNDVLLDDASVPTERRLYLVQHWNQKLETPTAPLKCLYGLACLLDQDHATATILHQGTADAVTMSNTRVSFVDDDGANEIVTLR